MTSPETTIEIPQITSFADVPTEFWIAIGIQFFVLVFGVWAFAKLIKFVINLPSRIAKLPPATDTNTASIDDDFADIAEEMKKEKNNDR